MTDNERAVIEAAVEWQQVQALLAGKTTHQNIDEVKT